MYLPESKRFVWAHGGLGMQRLSHLLAPYNYCSIVNNEFFFESGPNIYCDHMDHLLNEHRNKSTEISIGKYKMMLEHFKSAKHVIIHENGWGQYARILRILKHILNVQQYKNYEHIKVTDAKQIEGFRLAAQEIADGDFVNGPKLRKMSNHYLFTSHQMHQAGLDVLDVNYKDLYVNPIELVFEDIFEHMDIPEREYANYGYIVKQINEYHENNVKLICENIPNIKEKLEIFLDKQKQSCIM
tara:strand:+ start:304 stop:1029 length:726 start_codon:yes stop_codon:yes gene_type:complete